MIVANITFKECIEQLNQLQKYGDLDWIPISEIPKVLLEDFSKYNIGNTMSIIHNIECSPSRDVNRWIQSLYKEKGFEYNIKWKSDN